MIKGNSLQIFKDKGIRATPFILYNIEQRHNIRAFRDKLIYSDLFFDLIFADSIFEKFDDDRLFG